MFLRRKSDPKKWWQEFVSAVEAEAETPPSNGGSSTVEFEVPVAQNSVRADIVIKSNDKVILIETLPSQGSHHAVTSSALNTIGLIADQGRKLYNGKEVEVVVFPQGHLPESLRKEIETMDVRIISSTCRASEVADYFLGHGTGNIPSAGPYETAS